MARWVDYARAALSRVLQKSEPAIKPAPEDNSASALKVQPIYDQFSRIGGSITPEQVSAIYGLADTGYTWQMCDLGNEARQKDGTLQGLLAKRENALGPLVVQVTPFLEPGATKPTSSDIKIAEELKQALKECKGLPPRGGMRAVGLQQLKKHLQGGNWSGYAMAETVWQKNRQGLMAPAGFFCHSARRFGFRDTDGALVQWDQVGSVASQIKREVQFWQPMRWLQHQPRITGDVPAREGYGRVLTWEAIFRNWDVADVLKLAEMTWKPYRIGRFKPGTSDKDKRLIELALLSLTNNGIGLFSTNVEYEIRWPDKQQSSASNHLALAEFLGAEMAKVVVHGTLTTEAGDKGARSLGEVHERGFDMVVEDDSGNVGETLQRDVGEPFVRLNHGENAGVPDISLVTQDESDLVAFGNGVKVLSQDCGLKIPVKWVRDKTGVPEPDENEEILGEPTEEELAEAKKAEEEAKKAAEQEAAQNPPPQPGEEQAPVPIPPGQAPPAPPQPGKPVPPVKRPKPKTPPKPGKPAP